MAEENIIKAIKCLTEMIAELQCRLLPVQFIEDDEEEYLNSEKKNKWRRIRKILDIGEIEE